jgi:hypothetical protein
VFAGALLTDTLDTRASWVVAGLFAISGLVWLRPPRRPA